MAFSATVVNGMGRTMQLAYVRLNIQHTSRHDICVVPEAWESVELREQFPDRPYQLTPIRLPFNLDLQAPNPIAYAYQLLEASGLYPEATWNI